MIYIYKPVSALMSAEAGCDLVTDLPTSLSCSILSEWICTAGLARVDSAYCCKKRSALLDIFQCNEHVSKDKIRSNKVDHVSNQYWNWILRRDIKLSHIAVESTSVDAALLESYARRHEKHIGHLELKEEGSHPFALYCKHLVQLNCSVKFAPECRTLLRNNPTLRALHLAGLSSEHAELFESISLPNLTQLSLEMSSGSAEAVSAVLSMPSRLLKLSLWEIDADLLGVVAQLCPHLRSLSLHIADTTWEEPNIAEFTSHLPKLVNLELVDCYQLFDSEVLAVVQNLKELHSLHLDFHEVCSLTDTGIEYIAEHCAATLEVFHLKICELGNQITGESLDLVRSQCTKLHQFRVESFYRRPDAPLGAVTSLIVQQVCVQSTLFDISYICPRLEVLRLMHGFGADCSSYDLRNLREKCPKLRRIEVPYRSIANAKSWTATLPQVEVSEISNRDDDLYDLINMPI